MDDVGVYVYTLTKLVMWSDNHDFFPPVQNLSKVKCEKLKVGWLV
jgi:hypothetical protein